LFSESLGITSLAASIFAFAFAFDMFFFLPFLVAPVILATHTTPSLRACFFFFSCPVAVATPGVARELSSSRSIDIVSAQAEPGKLTL